MAGARARARYNVIPEKLCFFVGRFSAIAGRFSAIAGRFTANEKAFFLPLLGDLVRVLGDLVRGIGRFSARRKPTPPHIVLVSSLRRYIGR